MYLPSADGKNDVLPVRRAARATCYVTDHAASGGVKNYGTSKTPSPTAGANGKTQTVMIARASPVVGVGVFDDPNVEGITTMQITHELSLRDANAVMCRAERNVM